MISLKEKRDPICVGEKLGLIVNGQLDKASSINKYISLEIYFWAIIIRLFLTFKILLRNFFWQKKLAPKYFNLEWVFRTPSCFSWYYLVNTNFYFGSFFKTGAENNIKASAIDDMLKEELLEHAQECWDLVQSCNNNRGVGC